MELHKQSEERTLAVPLTAEELADKALELAEAVDALTSQEGALEDAKAKWKETKKALESELRRRRLVVNELAGVVEDGTEERAVPCDWLYALERGYAFLVRRDTQEVVTHRLLDDGERQTVIGEVLQEPTPEQLAEWTAALEDLPEEDEAPEDDEDLDNQEDDESDEPGDEDGE